MQKWLKNFLMEVYDDEELVSSLDEVEVIKFMNFIDERAEDIINLRYGDRSTYEAIGKKYNIGAKRVMVIVKELKRKFILHIDLIKLDNGEITIDENSSIDKLYLSVRAYNGLRRANVNTIRDLLNIPGMDLYRIRNIGKNTANEIITKLHSYGFKMNKDIEKYFSIRYTSRMNLKAISDIIYTPGTPSENMRIKIVKYDKKSKNDNELLWKGIAKDLKNNNIIKENYEVIEILLDSIEGEGNLRTREKGKIIKVRKLV